MRKIEQQRSTPHMVSVCTSVVCDLCAGEAAGPSAYEPSWDGDLYGVARTAVSMEVGDNYPEGGATVERRVDVCPTCFTAKLIPWLESQGATVAKIERDT